MASPTTKLEARQHLLNRSFDAHGTKCFKEVEKNHQVHSKIHTLTFKAAANPSEGLGRIRVGIIGGGVAGLYSAYLMKKHLPDFFDYTIFETEEKVGGRISTHKFSDEEFQYGEFGAMRIPDYHKPVLDLFDELGVARIPFVFSTDDSLMYVNGTKTTDGNIMTKKYASEHPTELGFIPIKIEHAERSNLPFIPEDFSGLTLVLKHGADSRMWESVASIYDAVYSELADALENNYEAFFDTYDQYSVDAYFHMIIPQYLERDCAALPTKGKIAGLIDSVLHYAEITSSATGLNHLALSESVLDNRNFESNQNWWTAKDGMYHFTDAMAATLDPQRIITKAKVISIEHKEGENISVSYRLSDDVVRHEPFDRIIMTAPFGSVRFMDVKIPFSYGKRQAIRSLNYDHSTKIFAQFPNRWWEVQNALKGGASSTDLPIHTVVYPSYGEGSTGKGVLLTSYTWQNDAIMWANTDDTTKKEVILANLATLHSSKVPFNADDIKLATHTWLEAFSLFGPGQFKLMVNAMIPEFGVHFAGEHLSTYHAWIIGALYSATRAFRELAVLGSLWTVEKAWEALPDKEFTEVTWKAYMNNVLTANKSTSQ